MNETRHQALLERATRIKTDVDRILAVTDGDTLALNEVQHQALLTRLDGTVAQLGDTSGALAGPSSPPPLMVTLNISQTPLTVSRMTPGVSHVNNPSSWREPGWNNAKIALSLAVGVHNLPITPFGLRDPWTVTNAATWTPGSEPNPALPNQLNDGTQNCLATALTKVREISATDPIMLTLYGAPWWMKGRLQADGSTIPCVYPADQFTDEGRIMTAYLPHWQTLITEACKLALAAGVRWVQVWNEFKDFYRDRFNTPHAWAWDDYSGTPGLNADLGYTHLYKVTVAAVDAAAVALGIDPETVKKGGPYPTLRSQGNIDADSLPATGYPTLYNRPWGTMNKMGVKAIEGFHNLVVAQGLPYDFLSIDFGPGNKDGVNLTTDEWVIRTKYTDIMDWVAAELRRIGRPDLPIVGAEVYAGLGGGANETGAAPGLVTAVKAETYRRLLLGGMAYPLAWGPEYTADNTTNKDAYIIDDTGLATGGTVQPWGAALQLFKDHFGPGVGLFTLTNSAPGVVSALASATKVLMINQTAGPVKVQVTGGLETTLSAYQVTVVDRV